VTQQRAVPLILAGRADNAVAAAVGVSRQTVWRWRNEDAVFIGLCIASGSPHSRQRANGSQFLEKALDVVEAALDEGSQVPGRGVARRLFRLW
jgi:Homeodomain-like domain